MKLTKFKSIKTQVKNRQITGNYTHKSISKLLILLNYTGNTGKSKTLIDKGSIYSIYKGNIKIVEKGNKVLYLKVIWGHFACVHV